MAEYKGEQDKWIISTAVVLAILCVIYFLFLFPKDATTIFQVYLSFFIASLIAILTIILTLMLYRKQVKKRLSLKSKEAEKLEKVVSQIIWRNRYVLQSQKSQLLSEPSLDNREKWSDIKKIFAEEYVHLTIPKSKISDRKVSELIEKSLQGASIGSIRPPAYSVKSINR
ncbi:MAG: putative membrane protein [Enterobacterales bacterium]|jgi:uncharacterized membrane protein